MHPSRPALRRCITAALALTALLAGPPSAESRTQRVPADFYGINANFIFRTDANAEAHFDAVAAGGIKVIRQHIRWNSVEPVAPDPVTGAHSYDWALTDSLVAAAAAHGLEIQPVVAYSASWASPANLLGPLCEPTRVRPTSTSAYAQFAAALARRYGRGGSFWAAHTTLRALPMRHYEIWNEQNSDDYWRPVSTAPADYAALYSASRSALHRVDPHSVAVIGGLVETGASKFVRGMIRARPGLARRVDAVAYHVYAAEDAAGVIDSVRGLRGDLAELGMAAVPIELTEFGWSRVGVAEPDRRKQFRLLARELPLAGLGVSRMMPYVWYSGDDAQDWDKGLGMAWSDGRLMPAGEGYLAGIAERRTALRG